MELIACAGLNDLTAYLHDTLKQKYIEPNLKEAINHYEYDLANEIIIKNDFPITLTLILDILNDYMSQKKNEWFLVYDDCLEKTICNLINSSSEKLTYDVLIKACNTGYMDVIKLIIKKGVNPDKQCYYNFWLSGLTNYPFPKFEGFIELFADNKIFLDITCLHNYFRSGWSWDILNILLNVARNNNVNIDLDIIDKLAYKNIIVDNLEKYNIKYDEQLYKICHKYEWYPVEYMNNIKKVMNKYQLKLYNLCKWTIYRISRSIKYNYNDDNGLDGDMNTACMIRLNKFAKSHNLVMDKICLDNILSGSLGIGVAKKFMLQYPDMKEKIDMITLSRINDQQKRFFVVNILDEQQHNNLINKN